MKRVALALCLVALAAAPSMGCATAPALAPGLANAPAIPLAETIDIHDVIANGHDSCPRARVAAADPLRFRFPACPGGETTPKSTALLFTPAVAAEPEDELWNLHLRGLPPCEATRAMRANELALAVCR